MAGWLGGWSNSDNKTQFNLTKFDCQLELSLAIDILLIDLYIFMHLSNNQGNSRLDYNPLGGGWGLPLLLKNAKLFPVFYLMMASLGLLAFCAQ